MYVHIHATHHKRPVLPHGLYIISTRN